MLLPINKIKSHLKSVGFLSLLLLCINQQLLFAAETDEQNDESEQDRWFEIEVIVYKSNSQQALSEEDWDKDTALVRVDDAIDFVEPEFLLTQNICLNNENITNESTGISPHASCNEDVITDNQAVSKKNNTAIVDIDSLDEEARLLKQINKSVDETPFVLLPQEKFQLKNEAASINRHSDYKLLTHLMWRQPVLGKTDGVSVRIAGGKNLADLFEYDGHKKNEIDSNTIMENQEFNQNQKSHLSSNFKTEQNKTEQALTEQITTHETQSNWVPELDGDIRIYLKRFLHIRTNLYLRRPDKEEIEAVDLTLYNPEELAQLSNTTATGLNAIETKNKIEEFTVTNPFNNKKSNTNSLLTPKDQEQVFPQKKPLYESQNLLTSDKNQFSWQLDDNFLNTESEKMYIERLFNYSLKQSRRVKSEQLHYFDHPLLGVLIMIRPYDVPIDPPQEQLIPLNN